MKISPDKKRILIVNTVVALIFVLFAIFLWPTFSGMFMPFFIAIILAYLLNPLVKIFERRGFGRGLSVLFVCVIVLLILFGVFMSFVPSLISNIAQMVTNIPSMLQNLQNYSGQISEFIQKYNDSDMSKYFNLEQTLSQVAGMFGSMLQGLSNAIIANSGQLMNIIIVPLVTIFLLLDKELFTQSLMYLVPIDARNQVKKMFYDIDMVIGGFIRGQGLMSIIAGILTGVGAYFMGLPYAGYRCDCRRYNHDPLFWPGSGHGRHLHHGAAVKPDTDGLYPDLDGHCSGGVRQSAGACAHVWQCWPAPGHHYFLHLFLRRHVWRSGHDSGSADHGDCQSRHEVFDCRFCVLQGRNAQVERC